VNIKRDRVMIGFEVISKKSVLQIDRLLGGYYYNLFSCSLQSPVNENNNAVFVGFAYVKMKLFL
jgi:hypothetical protein